MEETLRDNPAINSWRVADHGVEDRGVMAAFMQALGFSAQQNGWEKHCRSPNKRSMTKEEPGGASQPGYWRL